MDNIIVRRNVQKVFVFFLSLVIAFSCFSSAGTEIVRADKRYWFGTYSSRTDECVIQFKFWSLKSNASITMSFDISKQEFHATPDSGIKITSTNDSTLKISISKPKNEHTYKIVL